MAEQLYTIPVNDAFHADCECPLCQMQKTLEEHAIEYTMGPSYMEDDNRAMTDKMGFCSHHIGMLYKEKNRLGLALMLKTHTDKTIRDLKALSEKGTPAKAAASYLQMIKTLVPSEPVIHIDDSDVVKPNGYKFESLGIVRDGSESTSTKNVYKKGYHVTEACALTTSNHPVSIFSRIHSSSEKDYKSANTITFDAINQGGKNLFFKVENRRIFSL